MIQIQKVMNKHDLNTFISFPSSLYCADDSWIDPLHLERAEH